MGDKAKPLVSWAGGSAVKLSLFVIAVISPKIDPRSDARGSDLKRHPHHS